MLSLRAQLFPSRSQRLAKKEQKKAEKMAKKKATGVKPEKKKFFWERPFGPFACPPGAPSSHGNVSMA
eukprot:jgi/Pico_ML_1/51759/g320.t1